MCAVSMVYDTWGKRPFTDWSRDSFDEFQKEVDAAKKQDIRDKVPDCVDPNKERLVRDIIEYLKQTGKL